MSGHVAVIGAGVIGLCTALECARRGWRVTVVERHGPERDGCSFQNAGIIVPSHFVPLAAPGMVALGLKWMLSPASPFYVKPRASRDLADWVLKFWRACTADRVRRAAPLLRDLALASCRCYEALAAQDNDFGFEPGGTLMLCRTGHALEEEARTADYALELGLAPEVLGPAGTAALEPGLRMDVAGSVYYPEDCRLAPDRVVASLERRAAQAGVRFAWHTEATGWKSGSDGRLLALTTRSGAGIEADAFVLCAGAWSVCLARGLGVTLPIEAGKGYSLTLPHPRRLPRRCAILVEARVAVTPLGGALRFGGTMELSGLNVDVSPARVRGIQEAVPRYFPEFGSADFAGVKPWIGLRPCSPDGLPYLGRLRRHENLVVAAGHAMLGMTLGPVTGRIAAGILAGDQPEFDLTPLSPDRYDGGDR